ncbi:MAG: hypothetical protein C5B51_09945 [Terriglobia bacterium]|nr:MAG: hypothetical protein C5B51_09945 [Terriglobia bacterium]
MLLATGTPALFGSGTAVWEMNSYLDFIRGRFEGVSLSRDGRLSLAPKLDTVFSSDQPVIWSVVQAPDGNLYAATGHRGRVYRIDPAGKSSLVWTADQPEVFALAVDRAGALYAGTSPDGAVYRIENGKATEYFAPKTKYIWTLAAASDGVLYVGTGDQGRIFRVESAGKGELYYDTAQSHVTGLAVDMQGRLLAGTEPNGLLYRITAKDKAFVLYDSTLPEIRAIAPLPDGTVYAAALGGSIAKRAQSAQQALQNLGTGGVVTSGTTTTITVEAQQTGPGPDVKPPDPAKQAQQAAASATQVTTQFSPVTDTSGVEKSAVYRINPDNTVETLWTSKEEDVYDLLASDKQILFSTDESGRIYGLSPDRRVTLLLQTNEAETTRLLPSRNSVLAATGNMGRIFRLGETPGASGFYDAPVHDAGTAARWGSLSWRADLPAGAALQFRTRSGNSAKPDRTWSEWSEPLTNANGSRIPSPNARYIEWKAELKGANGATPLITGVTLAYLPQNLPPVIKSINVISQTAATAQTAKTSTSSGSSAFSVTVTDTDSAATSSGTPTQAVARASTDQISVTWQAEDPDGDRLVYALYFRGDDENQWKLLKGDLHENSLSFDANVLADGKYHFRVTATDRESNPPAAARDAELVSAPVLIDNTPPAITVGTVRYAQGTAHIEFSAADAASALRHCEYSLDAAGWVPLEAADGVIDSLRESFSLDLNNLSPGEHLVVLRAADSANNIGLAKVLLK